jgi:hypothetical protein
MKINMLMRKEGMTDIFFVSEGIPGMAISTWLELIKLITISTFRENEAHYSDLLALNYELKEGSVIIHYKDFSHEINFPEYNMTETKEGSTFCKKFYEDSSKIYESINRFFDEAVGKSYSFHLV